MQVESQNPLKFIVAQDNHRADDEEDKECDILTPQHLPNLDQQNKKPEMTPNVNMEKLVQIQSRMKNGNMFARPKKETVYRIMSESSVS